MEIHKSKKGFSLIEALVALFILALLLLGLLSSLIVVYDNSTKNLLRDEAVKIANEYAEKYRNMDFSSIPPSASVTEERKIRNAQVTYTVNVNSSDINNQIKRVQITVNWTYKGKNYSHTVETLVRGL
ncbi:prepilin-type N-terminal cleavage/methylation domain-containing protein [Persephonella sp. IF05-L8]|uniref:prepilin-type N-terminal cleavage/methylation domain-containing protein n=1 Tax=Persephonella sp. IF05-L8 TaxID=1158338 RepID=UPI000495D968